MLYIMLNIIKLFRNKMVFILLIKYHYYPLQLLVSITGSLIKHITYDKCSAAADSLSTFRQPRSLLLYMGK